MKLFGVWALLLMATASGRVVDPDGKPIPGAEACTGEKPAIECVKTDAEGFYRIENPSRRRLFIRAKGYVPVQTEAAEHVAPIALQRAAILTVLVVNAKEGTPIPSGRILLNYTSGQSIGTPAPFNKSGARMTTLVPGEVLVRAEADGYEPGGPEVVHLEGGVEKRVTISMRRKKG
jgi:hypothetical protein